MIVCVPGLLEQMDLSSITDPLWRRFYQREFGVDHTNQVIEKMKAIRGKTFTWRELFKVKTLFFLHLPSHLVAIEDLKMVSKGTRIRKQMHEGAILFLVKAINTIGSRIAEKSETERLYIFRMDSLHHVVTCTCNFAGENREAKGSRR